MKKGKNSFREENGNKKDLNKNSEKKKSIPITAFKKRLFFLITIFLPFLFFILLELFLRLINYGPDLSLFKTKIINDKSYYVMNYEVKKRYFYNVEIDSSSSPDYFLISKPAGTYRIFCLGGSTTEGYPYWFNGSFSNYLDDRLEKNFPGKNFEVINLGMTATNSFTVIDLANELIAYEPDLFVVYDGHNEFYGALGITSNESTGTSRILTNLYLKFIHFKTFIFLRDIFSSAVTLFSNPPEEKTGGTMMKKLALDQYVEYGSDTYYQALKVFKENLTDLAAICSSNNIPLILGTQVSNLRHHQPFISKNSERINPKIQKEFDKNYKKSVNLLKKNDINSALILFRKIEKIDSLHAGLHYQIGRCLDSLGLYKNAEKEYIKARDYDLLRFRASTEFNKAILEFDDGKNITSINMEKVFGESSPENLIGNHLIFEHLHPNSKGNFLMAKAYAEAMEEKGFLFSKEIWQGKEVINDDFFWNEKNITDLDERAANRRVEILTSGWPFTSHDPIVNPVSADDTLGLIAEQMIRGKWDWLKGHLEASRHYSITGNDEKEEKEYLVIQDQFPHNINSYITLARFYLMRNRIDEAQKELLASLNVKETAFAYRNLGDISLKLNNPEKAINFYERLMIFEQSENERIENIYLLSVAYFLTNKLDKAEQRIKDILNQKPGYKPAIELMSEIQSKKRKLYK